MIGRNKYLYLKSLQSLTDEEKQQIKDYEDENKPDVEKMKEYALKVNSLPEDRCITLEPWECWEIFKQAWRLLYSHELKLSPEVQENLTFLNRYFGRKEFEPFLSPLSVPNVDKGLLLVGEYGNGKSSVMRAYRKAFETFKGYSFKQYSANQVVEMYELALEPYQKRSFWKDMCSGVIHFDDVLSEDTASNYGKKEIFKDILEKRYDMGLKTHMTINTRISGDLKDAIEQLADRYGERVYDRVFEMFNIYYWKGKSFRK